MASPHVWPCQNFSLLEGNPSSNSAQLVLCFQLQTQQSFISLSAFYLSTPLFQSCGFHLRCQYSPSTAVLTTFSTLCLLSHLCLLSASSFHVSRDGLRHKAAHLHCSPWTSGSLFPAFLLLEPGLCQSPCSLQCSWVGVSNPK